LPTATENLLGIYFNHFRIIRDLGGKQLYPMASVNKIMSFIRGCDTSFLPTEQSMF